MNYSQGMVQMNRYQALKAERTRERAARAMMAWERLSAFCAARGAQARIFGSIAEDRGNENSDLDVMVFGDLPADMMHAIEREARAVSRESQVPIDLLFERDFPDLAKEI